MIILKTKIARGLRAADQPDEIFSADDHSEMSADFHTNSGIFDDRETLKRNFLQNNGDKLKALGVLAEKIVEVSNDHNAKSYGHAVLSLGSGHAVLEDFLRCLIPDNIEVIATDYDHFFVSAINRIFPDLTACALDFANIGEDELKKITRNKILVAFSFGSTYAMTDEKFIAMLQNLRREGVQFFLDFQAGHLSLLQMVRLELRGALKPIIEHDRLRRFLGKSPLDKEVVWKTHGYGRTTGELLSIYRAGGFVIDEKFPLDPYGLVAILRAS